LAALTSARLERLRWRTTGRRPQSRHYLHDARHCHATRLMTAGVHVGLVADRLGHGDTHMMLDRYSHVSSDLQWEVADKLERALG
jgi:integrase